MTNSKTFAYGTLGAAPTHFYSQGVNTSFFSTYPFLLTVLWRTRLSSVIGTMGVPSSSTATKLIVEKIAGHDAIARRAHEIHQSGHGGSADDNWFRAERELLGI